jgi:hypothetical protein
VDLPRAYRAARLVLARCFWLARPLVVTN